MKLAFFLLVLVIIGMICCLCNNSSQPVKASTPPSPSIQAHGNGVYSIHLELSEQSRKWGDKVAQFIKNHPKLRVTSTFAVRAGTGAYPTAEEIILITEPRK